MAKTSDFATKQTLDGMESLGQYIQGTLYTKWKSNRKSLEEKWHKNIDTFEGIDIGLTKAGEAGEDGETWRSKTCLNIVRNKCMSAFAVIEDQMLQGGRIPYMLKPVRDPSQTAIPPEQVEQESIAVKQNYDYMEEQLRLSGSENQLIQAFKIGTIYGEVYGKKYISEVTRSFYSKDTDEKPTSMSAKYAKSKKLNIEKRTVKCLAVKAMPPWDIFRDMENNDLRKCFGVIHRQFIAPYEMYSKKGRPCYLDKYIDTVVGLVEKIPYMQGTAVATGEDTSTVTPARRLTINKLNSLELLEYWGKAPKVYVENFEKTMKKDGMTPTVISKEDGEQGETIEIMAQIVNGYIIKFARTSPEDRPFYRVPFEDNIDGLGAIGVADNIQDLQTALNGAARAFEDNKRLAGDVILALKERLLANKLTKIRPGLRLQLAEECNDARQAVQQLVIKDVADGWLPLMAKIEQYADELSLIPKISQGISTKDAQTAYEISVQTERAGKYLGAIIKNFDKFWIEPFMTDLYESNMRDPEAPVPKNPYTVKALGFSSFQDRMVRLTKLQQFFGLATGSPEILKAVNMDWLITELAKAFDLDPDQLLVPIEKRNAQKEQEGQMGALMHDMEMKMMEIELAKKQMEIETMQIKAEAAMIKAQAGAMKAESEVQVQQLQATAPQTDNSGILKV